MNIILLMWQHVVLKSLIMQSYTQTHKAAKITLRENT